MKELTQEELKQILHYDPETGVFKWLAKVSNKGVDVGGIAGNLHGTGYVIIRLDGYVYRAHRLAFLYMSGSSPSDQVDHINGVRNDNRWVNLRVCTSQQNSFNRSKNKNNTSGYKGVVRVGGKWGASIVINGKRKSLGVFDTPEIASRVYKGHAKKLFGEFANVGGETNEATL